MWFLVGIKVPRSVNPTPAALLTGNDVEVACPHVDVPAPVGPAVTPRLVDLALRQQDNLARGELLGGDDEILVCVSRAEWAAVGVSKLLLQLLRP